MEAALDINASAARASFDRRLRVLTLSSLFPSDARPRHGIFVETRLAHLVRDCAVDVRVVAPVPWFPFSSSRFGQYAQFARTPRRTTRASGLAVSYPRYLMLPRVGVGLQPDSMARAVIADIVELQRFGWQPDLIDAHYLYPDGVAAALLSSRLKLAFVMTARGTDVNVLAHLPGPRQRVVQAARQASAVIAVSQPLKTALVSLGVDEAKVVVLRNGVDLDVFRRENQAASRARLGLRVDGRLLLCVGNLVPEKGQALAIEALRQLDGFRLLIVGDGPLHGELTALARRLGVEARVVLRPAMPQSELRHVYSSADALLLTSTREGWPNVVLESLACGTPVVGVDVGAVRDMIADGVGRIVAGRDPGELAGAIRHLLDAPVARERVRRHAAQFDWRSISRGQWDVFVRTLPPARRALCAGC